MPRQNPEHDGRLVVRLPAAMQDALKWTAEHDRLPLSDWVRNVLQEQCLSIRVWHDREVLTDRTDHRGDRKLASRKSAGKYIHGPWVWRGRRKAEKTKMRVYTDLQGKEHIGGLPPGMEDEQYHQDYFMDRAEARRELRTWLNRWGRPGKTQRLFPKERQLAQRLLASFDRYPE